MSYTFKTHFIDFANEETNLESHKPQEPLALGVHNSAFLDNSSVFKKLMISSTEL